MRQLLGIPQMYWLGHTCRDEPRAAMNCEVDLALHIRADWSVRGGLANSPSPIRHPIANLSVAMDEAGRDEWGRLHRA